MEHYFTFLSVLLFVAVFNLHNLNATLITSQVRTKNSVNPDDSDWDKDNLDAIDIASNCIKEHGSTYCTEMNNYPEDIDNLIADKYKQFRTFFVDDSDKPNNVTKQRVAIDPKQIVCSSTKRRIYPKAAQNKHLNWIFIINTFLYRQGLDVEECDKEGEKCGGINGIKVPSPYKVVCKQQFAYRSLIGLANNTLIREHYKIPSCCKCVLITDE